MKELLKKYKLTSNIFEYFRVPKSKAEKFLNDLEKEGYCIDDISIAFAKFEINNDKFYPLHWRNSIKYYLKEKDYGKKK